MSKKIKTHLEVRTADDLFDFIKSCRLRSQIIGRTEQGLPIYSLRLGGKRKPAIVIKAGSHASEIGAIYGALKVIEDGLQSDHEIHLIPCCCPHDFGGEQRVPHRLEDLDGVPLLIEPGELRRDWLYGGQEVEVLPLLLRRVVEQGEVEL